MVPGHEPTEPVVPPHAAHRFQDPGDPGLGDLAVEVAALRVGRIAAGLDP
jgi:hypothetical protein